MLLDPRFPNRPQHPDFWALSSAVLNNDARVQEDGTDVETVIGKYIDSDSLSYMATNRALSGLTKAGRIGPGGPSTKDEVLMVALVAASFVDGTLAGIQVEANRV